MRPELPHVLRGLGKVPTTCCETSINDRNRAAKYVTNEYFIQIICCASLTAYKK